MRSLILSTCVVVLLGLTVRSELASEPAPTPGSQRRVALVIGNAAYQLAPLRNPVRDATAMATTLRQLGFDVTLLRDADYRAMDAALEAFRQRRPGGVGLVYFAGHAVQIGGENYLIPLQARIEHEQDVRSEAVSVQRMLAAMAEAGHGMTILILDACRDNPYAGQWGASQSGLAVVQASSGLFAQSGRSKPGALMYHPSLPARGLFIAYATAPGGVAADGAGEHGVYTKHLQQAMTTPGLSIEQVFRQVRYGVVLETEGQQTPWESSSLLGDFAFMPAQAPSEPAGVPSSPASASYAPPPREGGGIEVRSGPGITYEVIVKVRSGERYVVLAQEQDWYKIRLPDGREGWIHRFYTRREQPPTPTWAAPVVATPPS